MLGAIFRCTYPVFSPGEPINPIKLGGWVPINYLLSLRKPPAQLLFIIFFPTPNPFLSFIASVNPPNLDAQYYLLPLYFCESVLKSC